MPDDASPGDIQEKIAFILGVRQAMDSMDAGKGAPKDKVTEMIIEWSGK